MAEILDSSATHATDDHAAPAPAESVREYLDDLKSDSEVIQELEGTRSQDKRALESVERMWKENLAMLEGYQWLIAQDQAILNVTGVASKGRERLVNNLLLDNARRLHARLDQPLYQPTVLSLTDDEGDRQGAQAAHGALRWFYHRREVSRQKRELNWWVVGCGVGYLEPYFDPQSGPQHLVPKVDEAGDPVLTPALDDDGKPVVESGPVTDPLTGAPVIDEITGQPRVEMRPKMVPDYEWEPLGDPEFLVRSPFQVLPDAAFQDWRKIRHVFVVEQASREEILATFGDAYKARTGDDLDAKLPKDAKVNPLPWVPDVAFGTQDYTGIPKPPQGVTGTNEVVRYYERPTKDYPKGRLVLYAGQAMLHRGNLPRGKLTLVKFGYLERPWHIFGKSPVDAAKALQRAYNRILSRYFEHLVRLPSGWLMIPTTSGIPKGQFSPEIGGVIRHNPAGGKPEFVFPPFAGLQWYERMLQILATAIEERMALPPSMRGQMPRGAKAARTVELLQEAADQVQYPVLSDMADGWREFWMMILELMDEHYTVDRMVYLLGVDKTPQVIEWKANMLPRDWRDRFLIQVESTANMPATRLGRMEFILTLARQYGVFGKIGDPETTRKILQALGIDSGVIPQETDLDEAIAGQENIAMERGVLAPVHPWDDDRVHLRVHLTRVKRLISAGRIEEAKPFQPHIERHEVQWQQKVQRAAPPAAAREMVHKPVQGTEQERPQGTAQPPTVAS